MYREDGAMERYDVFSASKRFGVGRTKSVIAFASVLNGGGIGDTLAKWYEADAIISQLDVQVLPIQVSHFAAEKNAAIFLLNESINALKKRWKSNN